ncbi:MAG TPA: hypothetical protein VF242_03630 [Nitrososphaeraceae archaeon]|jgi:hypothetical protein|nr:hypothetical protein [Nitrososphaeraceae archaeon]
MTTLNDDLQKVTSILTKTFEIPGIQRNYDDSFSRIGKIFYRYGINHNAKDLRIVFTLCMQKFFDSIPQEEWKLNDPSFVKNSELYAIEKFKEWFIEQVT